MGETIAFIGYGEAAQAFVEGWGGPRGACAYDIKLDDPLLASSKRQEILRDGVTAYECTQAAARGAAIILSVVTADQTLLAAQAAAESLAPNALYCDLNSAAPETKRHAARAIEAAGGRYADVAVMAPVRPALGSVPMLASGPHAAAATAALVALGFSQVRAIGGQVGQAAAIKMIRSVMIKGMEALTAECFVAAEAAGVLGEVLASLDGSDKKEPWTVRADYNVDRMMLHGVRRAAEMEEVVKTLQDLGVDPVMTRGTVERQRAIGLLGVTRPPEGLAAKTAFILERKARAA